MNDFRSHKRTDPTSEISTSSSSPTPTIHPGTRGAEGFNPQHLSVFKHWDKDINVKPKGSASVTGTEGFNLQHIHMFNPHRKQPKNTLPPGALNKGGYYQNPSSTTMALQRARAADGAETNASSSASYGGHEMELSHQAAVTGRGGGYS